MLDAVDGQIPRNIVPINISLRCSRNCIRNILSEYMTTYRLKVKEKTIEVSIALLFNNNVILEVLYTKKQMGSSRNIQSVRSKRILFADCQTLFD